MGDQLVVYDETHQRLHVLNQTTALVWGQCDGNRTVADIVEAVRRDLNSPADLSVVELALVQLEEAQLLHREKGPAGATTDVSRRQMLQRVAAVAVGVLLPSITSCGLPVGPDGLPIANALADLTVTTTSTSETTPLGTTTSTTGTTTTSTTGTTTTSTTGTTSTSTTATTPVATTTTSTTTPLVTTTSTTTTTPLPKKVTMCLKGKTITVDRSAVPGLLKAGATPGPCQ